MKKTKYGLAGLLALTLLASLAFWPGIIHAIYNDDTATGLTNLKTGNIKITDTGIYDSSGNLRYQPGSTNAITGSLTVSGTSYFQISVSSAPRDTSASIGITPGGTGPNLVWNSTDKELCVSTGTTRFTWVEVSTLAVVACRH